MKILVTYYSRTGTTKKVAEALSQRLGAEIEEIKDTQDRSGVKGYLISGRDAMKKRLTTLQPVKFNPADFEQVIIGTPIWAWNLSAPVRTYLEEQKNHLKSVALFCTMGSSDPKLVIKEAEKIIQKKIFAQAGFRTVEVVKNEFTDKLEEFAQKLEKKESAT
jgi:menaquinone-dependent protoporphyrinogen IX oxidase